MAMGNKKVYLSRLFVYFMARKVQDRIGQKGAELKSTLESMTTFGVPEERFWPFEFGRVDKEPSMQARMEAANYKLHSFEHIPIDKFRESIDNNVPIVIGMHTGKLFWNLKGPLQSQVYKPVNSEDNRKSNGHAVTIVGYDDDINSGSWIIANSLGPKWGEFGYGAIPYTCNVDIGESYVLNSFAGMTPGKNISAI